MNEPNRKCFICEKKHKVLKCQFFDELKALRAKIRVCIENIITKNKRRFITRVYNGNNDNENNNNANVVNEFDLDSNEKEEKIVVLFKKMINKILKFK